MWAWEIEMEPIYLYTKRKRRRERGAPQVHILLYRQFEQLNVRTREADIGQIETVQCGAVTGDGGEELFQDAIRYLQPTEVNLLHFGIALSDFLDDVLDLLLLLLALLRVGWGGGRGRGEGERERKGREEERRGRDE